jgi:hypothetical protein
MGMINRKHWKKSGQQALNRLRKVVCVAVALIALGAWGSMKAQSAASKVGDITGDYQFLEPYNTLAILQEDEMLKGYIDVLQGQSESDAIISYPITIGERKGDHVEFRTRTIHEMYYRFSGTVQSGSGKKKGDPDYLELAGELQTIKKNSVTNQQTVERKQVVFKSKGKTEREP